MIYRSEMNKLISQWEERAKKENSQDYNDALFDCIYDLKKVLDSYITQEEAAMTYEDALESIHLDESMAFDGWSREFYLQ